MKKQVVEKDPKEMRHGYTTGACATACTKAALLSMITQQPVSEVEITLPIGETVRFKMEQVQVGEEQAACSVIKDAGDDPDATHGARIVATVSWSQQPGVQLDGGVGVGRVTKPGLPVPVGEAAINPVPRKMIMQTANEVISEFEIQRGVKIVISVPDGEEIAKKTLNERLGIMGGISILGTRGIVVPFSTAAYRASVAQAIQVARANGCEHLVLTTGGSSEKHAMRMLPDLSEEAFIQMGDFVGFALKHAKKAEVKKVTLVGMMGKFSKVAQGVMMVHSKSAPVSLDFLAQVAKEVGATADIQAQIREANNATHAAQIVEEAGYTSFFSLLCQKICQQSMEHVEGGFIVETILVKMKGELLGRATVA
ncbi:cobalt-precorrin-5B (C(1))-methyltransferase [Thermoflavimicrobium daqui]|jgi:cobalt-precorrin-5B (C1)-methyltransferase|uniref:Cobalt-precorrin-5B C(1)-methyltransferase n=1 Tax=Thermoflavimicrobium daqui TaxID=2137476 RepID=A0A364K7V8_9BACL|nr:cobalt-precorrin-5B (C(1))-methyltransferase [Thermoflavimicrobium daqui]RAL26290.1 cobalt-precorrin-5B (C(1))-methyltransferase [Thermoflavimicrobium daqui]